MSRLRLIPVVVVATSALLGLKALEFASKGFSANASETTAFPRLKSPSERQTDMQSADPFADVVPDPITTAGGGGAPKSEPKAESHGGGSPAVGQNDLATPSKVDVKITDTKPTEAKPIPGQELLSEIAILQRLAERRKQIEQREKELETRELLLKATEDKLDKRVDELKSIENKIGATVDKKEDEKARELGNLVKMYESMKAKDAARVFDRLDTKLLVDIARQMNPKKLGDVVSKMSPDVAEKLTVELASRKSRDMPAAQGRDLPKIDGKS